MAEGYIPTLCEAVGYNKNSKVDSVSGGITKIGNIIFIDISVSIGTTYSSANDTVLLSLPATKIQNSQLQLSLHTTGEAIANSNARVYSGSIIAGYTLQAGTTYDIKGFYTS